jgi:SAM-dependent methyltransferase
MVTQPLWRRAAKQIKLLLYRCATPIDRVLHRNTSTILPPAHLRLYYYGTLQPARFAQSCETAALELTSRGLKPEHRVLDIGSGLGNLALGLTSYLQGGYHGVEVHPEAARWCQTAITPRHPRFEFHHADLVSNAYNPRGRLSPAAYRFPFDDHAFDFVFLSSVFTHMLPKDVEHYVREISRLLAPGGTCVESYFLLNEQTRRGVEEGLSFMSFDVRHASGLCRLHDLNTPEAAVALEEAFVQRVHDQTGLRIDDVRRGGWWNGEAHQQDVITSRRP